MALFALHLHFDSAAGNKVQTYTAAPNISLGSPLPTQKHAHLRSSSPTMVVQVWCTLGPWLCAPLALVVPPEFPLVWCTLGLPSPCPFYRLHLSRVPKAWQTGYQSTSFQHWPSSQGDPWPRAAHWEPHGLFSPNHQTVEAVRYTQYTQETFPHKATLQDWER